MRKHRYLNVVVGISLAESTPDKIIYYKPERSEIVVLEKIGFDYLRFKKRWQKCTTKEANEFKKQYEEMYGCSFLECRTMRKLHYEHMITKPAE